MFNLVLLELLILKYIYGHKITFNTLAHLIWETIDFYFYYLYVFSFCFLIHVWRLQHNNKFLDSRWRNGNIFLIFLSYCEDMGSS